MMKTRLAIAVLLAAGLAASPLTVQAKSYKHTRHSHTSSMTTGSNMKSSGGTTGMSRSTRGNTSSEGNVGPGTTNNNGPAPGGR
ncbi:hypothetical protein [Bradyrhizobium sp. STM 3562]|uniref:hypothetical protein n=1 Tax=Bradyrhizobium sp. STM 3562 TaxID=578924 RepID=UPI00388DE764